MEQTELSPQDVEVDGDDLLTDSGRNWSPDVLLELVKIWRRMFLAHPDWSRVQRMQAVYDAFKQTVDCSQRSRKAVDDKLYSMKQMYQFISQVKDQFKQGGPDKAPSPSWFELTKEERRVVRTLHRVRIPNISLEVYNVFDSVLSPSAVAARKTAETSTASQVTSTGDSRGLQPAAPIGAIPNEEPQEMTQEILDVKRNWSYDVTLQLARVWNSVHKENPALRGATLSLNVYNAFMAAVGGSNRSRKAVDDKMHSMREMYRFMKSYETKRITTGDPKTPWFDLTKPERRAVRAANKIRVPNLAPDVYNEIDMLMTRMNQISPADTPIESASTPVPSVDSEGIQHNSNIAASTFLMNSSNGVSSAAGQSLQGNGHSGQITCECGAKRHLAPATMAITSTSSNGTLLQQQQQQQLQSQQQQQLQSQQQQQQIQSQHQLLQLQQLQQQTNRQAPITTMQTPNYSAQQVAGQGTQKRQRTMQEPANSMTSSGMVDSREFMEQMRLSFAQDREERRQQHVEQMSALREIAALLKQRR